MVYEGVSMREAMRQFTLLVIRSKNAQSKSYRSSVTLFKNYEIIREYYPPDPDRE
jgi:hypothetical protein